jgi:hypothetical protein
MRFREKSLEQMAARIGELGLSECPVCHTGAILVARHPALIPIGGLYQDKADPRHDPDADVIFAVRLTCDVCGYMLLFDSEKFQPSNETTLFVGSEELEAEWEAEQGPADQR